MASVFVNKKGITLHLLFLQMGLDSGRGVNPHKPPADLLMLVIMPVGQSARSSPLQIIALESFSHEKPCRVWVSMTCSEHVAQISGFQIRSSLARWGFWEDPRRAAARLGRSPR